MKTLLNGCETPHGQQSKAAAKQARSDRGAAAALTPRDAYRGQGASFILHNGAPSHCRESSAPRTEVILKMFRSCCGAEERDAAPPARPEARHACLDSPPSLPLQVLASHTPCTPIASEQDSRQCYAYLPLPSPCLSLHSPLALLHSSASLEALLCSSPALLSLASALPIRHPVLPSYTLLFRLSLNHALLLYLLTFLLPASSFLCLSYHPDLAYYHFFPPVVACMIPANSSLSLPCP